MELSLKPIVALVFAAASFLFLILNLTPLFRLFIGGYPYILCFYSQSVRKIVQYVIFSYKFLCHY